MKTIIKNPRVTEKGSNALAQNVYTFDVARGATKMEIKKTIFQGLLVSPNPCQTPLRFSGASIQEFEQDRAEESNVQQGLNTAEGT